MINSFLTVILLIFLSWLIIDLAYDTIDDFKQRNYNSFVSNLIGSVLMLIVYFMVIIVFIGNWA